MTNAIAQPVWTTSKWLSRNEAARYIHVHNSVITELIESGELPASVGHGSKCAKGEVLRINIDDLDAYMYAHLYTPAEEVSEPDKEEAAEKLKKFTNPSRGYKPKRTDVGNAAERAAYLQSVINKPKGKRRGKTCDAA